MISSLQPNRPRVATQSTLSTYRQQTRPKSQVEAMPPYAARNINPCHRETQMAYEAATRHPAFFTERLKKAPAGVLAGNVGKGSPVCEGYIYEDGVRREGNARL